MGDIEPVYILTSRKRLSQYAFVMDCPYYHQRIDRMEAEKRLKHVGQDGSFLVRDSGSNQGVYILCLLHKMTVFQYRILKDKNGRMYIESTTNQAPRSSMSLGELIEQYLSRGGHNGLKTALVRGVRPDGVESSDDDSEDDTYVDHKYIKGKDDVVDTLPPPVIRQSAAHIYSEPSELVTEQAPPLDSKIHTFYSEQLKKVDSSRVGPDFVTKVQRYVDQNLVDDCLNMHKEPSRLSANHLSMLKQLLDEETACLKRQLNELLHKVDYLREVLAKPGADALKKPSHIDSESSFNTLVGLLSNGKQELCTLEMEAVNSFNEMSGYANVDPLAIKKPASSQSFMTRTHIPVSVFKVRVVNKAILGVGGNPSLTLKIDIQKGHLNIVKENSQALDSTNTFTADKIIQVIKSTKNSRMLEIVIEGRRKDAFYFDDIRQREHFCQLIQQLKKLHSHQTDVETVSVFCGTWNMGNEMPPQMGLQSWLKSQGTGKTRLDYLSMEPHDMYAIGTQEAKVSERDWVNRVKKLLHNMFNVDFHLVDVCTLWQIRIVIFVKPEYKNRINSVQQGVVRTGVANTFGNKGAATISFNFDGTSLCFLCCHLAANRERLARRNQNSKDILKNLSSSLGHKGYADYDITNQFNHVFWIGDFNYRVDADIKVVLELANSRKYEEMLVEDQMLNTINAEKVFYGFDEEVITFPPTYRYYKQSKESFDWKKEKKSGPKINAPSWCDRVIWKSYPGSPITNTSYGILQDVMTSDHKPVFASFTLNILPQNISKSVDTITTPIDVKLTDLTCDLMFDQSNDKSPAYYILINGQCLEAPCESQTAKTVSTSEGVETAQWNETLTLKPSFSDPSYLVTQHILIAVKSIDGMVIGDGVLSLQPIFQDHLEYKFQCELTYLGGKTGTVIGVMKAGYHGAASRKLVTPKRSSYNANVVVTDTYASPLSDLTWEEAPTPTPLLDAMPRVKGRPKSFMANTKTDHSTAKRALPPLPAIYDVPHTLAVNAPTTTYDSQEPHYDSPNPLYDTPNLTYDSPPPPKSVGISATQRDDSESPYYNTLAPKGAPKGAGYCNVDLHNNKPTLSQATSVDNSRTAVTKVNPVFQSGTDDEAYEEAETVRPPPRDPRTHARRTAVRQAKSGTISTEKSPQPKPRRRKVQLQESQESFDLDDLQDPNIQSTATSSSWLMNIAMSQYIEIFRMHNWHTVDDISHLTKEQLLNAGVESRHIFKILDATRKLLAHQK